MGAQGGPELLVLAAILLFVLFCARWQGALVLWGGQEPDPEAEERAAALQRDLLSEEELRELRQLGYLTVRSPGVAGRVYHVPAQPGWVEIYDASRLEMKVCVEPVERLPAADVVLMHKLMIEGDERLYMSLANVVYLQRTGPGRRGIRGN